jgi:monofunctional biosynthetic peptidoglycan transglycosylase
MVAFPNGQKPGRSVPSSPSARLAYTSMLLGLLLALPVTDLNWFVVNDTVMGGVSRSTVQSQEVVRFSGELSLEQNGGFTSMRAALPEEAMAEATALQLELRGDGRTYDVTLRRSDVPLRAGSYRVQVETQAGQVNQVVLPLSAFRPTSFGRPVSGAPALDANPGAIDTLGVLLADGQPGAFSLEILSLAVVKGAQPRAEGHAAVVQDLAGAVSNGVPVFNAGDPAGCRDLYAAALQRHAESRALTPGERAIIGEALSGAQGQQAVDAAWILRAAIDTVLASST